MTRSLPLARPSRASAFGRIPFAASQAAKVPRCAAKRETDGCGWSEGFTRCRGSRLSRSFRKSILAIAITQGRLADSPTLGFAAESLWDSTMELRCRSGSDGAHCLCLPHESRLQELLSRSSGLIAYAKFSAVCRMVSLRVVAGRKAVTAASFSRLGFRRRMSSKPGV